MATVVKLFNSSIEVPVVDHEGTPLGESRTFVNTPFAHYFGGDTFVIIDWLALTGERPDVATISAPVTADGIAYMGDKCGGSLVKRGQTFGVTSDYLVETGLADKISDVVRFKRAFLADGLYGGGVLDDLDVTIVKAGKLHKGLPVEDGFGYISRSLANKLKNDHALIKSNGSRESFQFWQSVPWTPEVQAECIPLILENLVNMADPGGFAFNSNSAHHAEKKEWVDLEADLQLHPYIANSFARDRADLFRRAAGTCPTNAKWRVAVPTTLDRAAVTEETVLYRYPIDSYAAIQVSEGHSLAQPEIDRIAQMEIIQFSLTAPDAMFASGCLGVVDDDVLGGPDKLVICADNIKLSVDDLPKTKARDEMVLNDAALVFTQYYVAGSGLGVGTAFFKQMGGDYDGDLVTFFPVVQADRSFHAVVNAIRSLPDASSRKLKKSRIPLAKGDRRAEMLVNNMVNLVGFASNLRSATFMLSDRTQMAKSLGFGSIEAMDELLNFYISAGTDGYKSFVLYKRIRTRSGEWRDKPITLDQLMKEAGVLQSNIITLFHKMAPETGWARSDWAFTREIPQVIEKGQVVKGMDKDRLRLAIHWWMSGTVQEIAKIALPNLDAALDTPIESKPLSAYRGWASRTDKDLYTAVAALQVRYNGRIRRLNFASSDAVEAFKAWWQQSIADFITEGDHDRWEVANALWIVAHSTRSTASGAASVFLGMPEEAKRIVTEKPGKASRKADSVVMTGLLYNVQDGPTDSWDGTVQVVLQPIRKGGKVVHRAVVCPIGDHPFEFTPKAAGNVWPEDMLGVVAVNESQPDEGFYAAAFARRGDAKAWDLRLS